MDGKPLPENYFSTGVFKTRRDGELFQCYTCEECGERLSTWASFLAHRADCRQRERQISPSKMASYPTPELDS